MNETDPPRQDPAVEMAREMSARFERFLAALKGNPEGLTLDEFYAVWDGRNPAFPLGMCDAGRVMFIRDPDGVWPVAAHPCKEPGVKTFRMVTPGEGRYEVRAVLCEMHNAEFLSHFRVVKEPFTPEGRTYQVRAKRTFEPDSWELTIPDVGVTQCQWLGDAWQVATDYILVQTGETVRQENIRLAVEGEPEEYLRRPGEEP